MHDTLSDIVSDILSEIISHVDAGSTYKACTLVSRAWHRAAQAQAGMIERLSNQLVTLLRHFPDEEWDSMTLANNPRIKPDFIMSNSIFTWRRKDLSLNPNIMDMIDEEDPYQSWDYDELSSNPGITPEFILAHVDDLDWELLSDNDSLSSDFVMAHQTLPWRWNILSCNFAISLEVILAHRHLPWNWACVSRKVTSLDVIDKYPEIKFDIAGIMESLTNVTVDIVRRYSDVIYWDLLSYNPNITIDVILAFPVDYWEWPDLSSYANITLSIVKAHPELPWKWKSLSYNNHITTKEISENLYTAPWNWYILSRNPNVTLDIIKNNPGLPWDADGLSRNVNMTAAFIISRPDLAWDWRALSANTFESY